MAAVDWQKTTDVICQLLTKVYVEDRTSFANAAAARGITIEQLAAAAITEMVRELTVGAAGTAQRVLRTTVSVQIVAFFGNRHSSRGVGLRAMPLARGMIDQ